MIIFHAFFLTLFCLREFVKIEDRQGVRLGFDKFGKWIARRGLPRILWSIYSVATNRTTNFRNLP